jgi:hypothetical protein
MLIRVDTDLDIEIFTFLATFNLSGVCQKKLILVELETRVHIGLFDDALTDDPLHDEDLLCIFVLLVKKRHLDLSLMVFFVLD